MGNTQNAIDWAAASDAPGGLDFVDIAMLELERRAAAERMPAGVKANRVRDLGLTEIGYYRRLNVLIDSEAALAQYPVEVNRLRRLRDGGLRRITR